METFLFNFWWLVVVLAIMIVLHELGHFAAAKWFGVRVDVFSIGFGKRLAGFRRGDTDYRISALPLGGYVKMAGENPLVPRSGAPEEFMSHPAWQRFVIIIAGPAMNILLAVGLLTGVYMVHYEQPVFMGQPAVIGWVMENTPASQAGLAASDRITRIDGRQNPTWEDVFLKIIVNSKQPVDIAIQRGDQTLDKTIRFKAAESEENPLIEAGLIPDEQVTVTMLEPDMPAADAGLRVGDQIIAVNGLPARSSEWIIQYLQKNESKPVEVTVERNGQQLKISATPVQKEDNGKPRYRLGLGLGAPVQVDKLPFAQALSQSIEQNKKYSLLIVDLVRKMVERKASIKQLEGPIGIARASGDAARQPGWTPLLGLMAMISLNLGVINLLPIPILDGGHILLIIVEAVIRRDISIRIKERIYQTAFVFILLFFVVVIYNDLLKVLPGLAQRLP